MEKTLEKTVYKMLSADYRERFKAEYDQLTIRLNKLDDIIKKHYDKTNCFEYKCPIAVLEAQRDIMAQYKALLEFRAGIEEVDL